MAANTLPIFSLTPRNDFVAVTAANTSSQGGGTIATDIFKLATAGANGSWIGKIRWIPTASAAGTATTATVARVFLSTQSSGATTSSNTTLIAEIALTAQTADSASAAVVPIDIPLNLAIASTQTILVTNHAAPAANTQWKAVLFNSGDY